jgi:hypothetical protein
MVNISGNGKTAFFLIKTYFLSFFYLPLFQLIETHLGATEKGQKSKDYAMSFM